MRAVDKLCSALAELDMPVFYTGTQVKQAYPYILYTDYTKSFNKADDRIDDVIAHIQVDYYTQNAFDGAEDRITAALDKQAWPFDTRHTTEDDQKLHHYIWDVQIEDDVE